MKKTVHVLISQNVPMNPENVRKIHETVERHFGGEIGEIVRKNIPPLMSGEDQKKMAEKLIREVKPWEIVYIASAWACPILVAVLAMLVKERQVFRVLVQDNGQVMDLIPSLPIY